jgi:inner membrane transporter RhtA
VEFTGPLAVAVLSSRRPIDFLWVGFAALGVVLLAPWDGARLDPHGLAFSLGAGVCWALYIVFGKRAGEGGGGRAASLGMTLAALIAFPVGYAQARTGLFAPAILPAALGVAVLSSALPYSLEMAALSRLPQRTFGVLMSLEPALGALSGLVLLGERLTSSESAAIACVMAASFGSAATTRASEIRT